MKIITFLRLFISSTLLLSVILIFTKTHTTASTGKSPFLPFVSIGAISSDGGTSGNGGSGGAMPGNEAPMPSFPSEDLQPIQEEEVMPVPGTIVHDPSISSHIRGLAEDLRDKMRLIQMQSVSSFNLLSTKEKNVAKKIKNRLISLHNKFFKVYKEYKDYVEKSLVRVDRSYNIVGHQSLPRDTLSYKTSKLNPSTQRNMERQLERLYKRFMRNYVNYQSLI